MSTAPGSGDGHASHLRGCPLPGGAQGSVAGVPGGGSVAGVPGQSRAYRSTKVRRMRLGEPSTAAVRAICSTRACSPGGK
ncbi:hypothetical protein GCM10009790_37210 [Georgenia ruanii]